MVSDEIKIIIRNCSPETVEINGKNFDNRIWNWNCWKDQLNALKGIANDDYLKNIFPRIDYAEMYLENLSVLLFGKCPHRNKYQNKLNKLFKKLENTCKKKCRVMGYDYFFFYPQEAEEVDYIQSYYDIHSEHEDVLGQPIYSLNWKSYRKGFLAAFFWAP